jgi:acetyltransferase-like isoleucine patch superfamily enzyme
MKSAPQPIWGRVYRALRSELVGVHPRRMLAEALISLLPRLGFPRLRARFYRLAGAKVGRSTMIVGALELQVQRDSPGRLRIGERCWFNVHVFVDLSADVTIGDNVTIGHHCKLITAGHEFGPPERRCGDVKAAPLVIGDGCWLGAGVILLPGVTIGRGSVVAAGAVVSRDVPPDMLVAGVPARPVRSLVLPKAVPLGPAGQTG